MWIDFISSIRVTHPPTITLPDTKSLLKSFSPILNPYTLGCSLLQRGLEEVIESGVTGVSVRAWMCACVCEREREGERRISVVTVLFSCFSHNGGQNLLQVRKLAPTTTTKTFRDASTHLDTQTTDAHKGRRRQEFHHMFTCSFPTFHKAAANLSLQGLTSKQP